MNETAIILGSATTETIDGFAGWVYTVKDVPGVVIVDSSDGDGNGQHGVNSEQETAV